MSTQEALTALFERDLDRAIAELKAYQKESNLWIINGEISNSAGNLLLHICGNLRHFIGSTLGDSGYIRRRDDEFNLKEVKKSEILAELKTTKKMIKQVLPQLTEEQMDSIYPINVFKKEMTTRFFLLHLNGHLNYHLGQINYHRRLLDN
jgi:uncharacterized damage-inducible protein DinB